MLQQAQLQKELNRCVNNRSVFGAVMEVSSGNEHISAAAGNMVVEQPYYIASITKLYVTAIVLSLQKQQRIDINHPINRFLDKDIIEKLLVYKGVDLSEKITVKQLLSQTSGLPDYFEDKLRGESLLDELIQGKDRAWSFEDSVNLTKQLKPKFAPGSKGKAHYSDSNFQLLGKVIENICRSSFENVLNSEIIHPLGLANTWLFTHPQDQRPAPIYFKNKPLHIPQAMSSFGADGGIVSTAHESMVFLKAFFGGYFFPKVTLPAMKQWNSVMFPLEYGTGIMRFKLPRIFSPFRPSPEFLGHSGLSGAFAFYLPEKEAFFTGTVNQVSSPSISFRLMLKVASRL